MARRWVLAATSGAIQFPPLAIEAARPHAVLEHALPEEDWFGWLMSHGKRVRQRLPFPWNQNVPEYVVTFDLPVGIGGGEATCSPTFLVSMATSPDRQFWQELSLTLFATRTLENLRSRGPTPALDAPAEADGSSNRSWRQVLLSSVCLDIEVDSDDDAAVLTTASGPLAHLYGGCDCISNDRTLLFLSDLLACSFGRTEIRHLDSERESCPLRPHVSTPRHFLDAIRHGSSRFVASGYRYHSLSTHVNMLEVQRLSESFLDWDDPQLEEMLKLYEHALGGRATKMNRDFALWVWHNYCEIFDSVVLLVLYNFVDEPQEVYKPLQCTWL